MNLPIMQYIPKDGDYEISPTLLWEYDLDTFDWEKSKRLVVQRIIERGRLEDFAAGIKLYGGIEAFREIIKEVRHLGPKDMTFVCHYFNLKKEELECYKRKLLREQLLPPRTTITVPKKQKNR